ncbi:MAG TPA: hypothetical protein VIW03_14985 [Anaeromyxobacter sp.]
MRFERIVGPALLSLLLATLPGLAVAVQVLAVVLAVAPVLLVAAHRGCSRPEPRFVRPSHSKS